MSLLEQVSRGIHAPSLWILRHVQEIRVVPRTVDGEQKVADVGTMRVDGMKNLHCERVERRNGDDGLGGY